MRKLNLSKVRNLITIIIGSILIGYFFKSYSVGIGIFLIALSLMPED